MQISLTGRHYTISDDTREYANEKLNKLTRYFDRIEYIEGLLGSEHDKMNIELKIGLPKAQPIIVKSEEETMYAAIDTSFDKAERRLSKFKEKRKEETHRV